MTRGRTKLRLCNGCGKQQPSDMFITPTRCIFCGRAPILPKRHIQFGITEKEYRHLVIRLCKYKLTPEQFFELVKAQEGKCAICGEFKGTKLWVDHCHSGKQVRALLCCKCNNGLGQFNDDPILLSKAIAYLEAHKNLLVKPD